MSIFTPGFTEAYSKTTGEKHTIPEEWLDHPVLGKDFAKTPARRAADSSVPDVALPEGQPTDRWTIAQLTKFAADHGIAVVDAKVKADFLAAIENHAAAHASAEDGSITPDAGDEE